MKKLALAVALSAVTALGFQPANAAVNVAVAVPGSFAAGYATPQLVLSKSAPATLVNLDVEVHDIRSVAKKNNGQPLWKSEVIGTGETSTIEGLDNAESDTEYEFFCVVHESTMRGTAMVID